MVFPWPYFDDGLFPRQPHQPARFDNDDDRLARDVAARLRADPRTCRQRITVQVQNRVAVLTGSVATVAAACAAGEQAWATPGVVDVCNALHRPPDDEPHV